jgi:hypothetical protein
MGTVVAVSPTQPLRVAPTSTERMSPSRNSYFDGKPWTTCSLTDAQIE